MKTKFYMTHRVNLGNMHINLNGYVDELAAAQLLNTIKQVHVGAGRIFVDTRQITGLSKKASDKFKISFNNLSISNNNLYIKGKQGLDLIPNGGRLIMFNEKKEDGHKEHKEHSCSGSGHCNCTVPCKVCKCAEKRKKEAKQTAV